MTKKLILAWLTFGMALTALGQYSFRDANIIIPE